MLSGSSNGASSGRRVASGFLLRHGTQLYLYTCWHVVTGLDFREPVLPTVTQQRTAFLEMSLQDAHPEGPTLEAIGGNRKITIQLYDSVSPVCDGPRWEQYRRARPNDALASVGLAAPIGYDIVRIPLFEQELFVSESLQVHSDVDLWREMLAPGDPLFVVGYPYGFSSSSENTQGVVLARTPAQAAAFGQEDGPYLDNPCAPGMSGGPVLVEMGAHLFIVGVYTGARYPDGPTQNPRQSTALGTFSPFVGLFFGPEHEFVAAKGIVPTR